MLGIAKLLGRKALATPQVISIVDDPGHDVTAGDTIQVYVLANDMLVGETVDHLEIISSSPEVTPYLVEVGDPSSWHISIFGGAGGITPPPAAVAAGYTRLAFQEEFDDELGIDVDNTGGSEYNFYLHRAYGNPPAPRESVVVANSVLTLTRIPTTTAIPELKTTYPTGTGTWNGFSAAGGAYFEARCSWDPSQEDVNLGASWPAFWKICTEAMYGVSTVPDGHLEMDTMEWFGTPGGDIDGYGAGTHWWATDGSHEPLNPGHGLIFPWGTSTNDFNNFHTYGCLWIPNVTCAYYFDNTFTREDNASDAPRIASVGARSYSIVLSAGLVPMRVDYVRVWQAP